MKKLFSLLLVVVMVAALAVTTSAAEVPSDGLIGHFKLDGDIVNAVDGKEGVWYASGSNFGEALFEPDEQEWYQGVDGYAFYCGNGDGFSTEINPGDNDFTVSFWICEMAAPGYVPYFWYGPQNQSPETWVGCWNVLLPDWSTSYGPCFASNDPSGNRYMINPPEEQSRYDEEAEFQLQWTNVVEQFVLEAAEDGDTGSQYTVTLYIDGENMGSVENVLSPYTEDYEDTQSYMYFNGVNAWGDNASTGCLDDILIYNRALSEDEIAALYASYTVPAPFETYDDFAAAYVDVADIGGDEPADTQAPETKAPETEAPETKAPAADTQAPETKAPEEEKSGCGSAMGAAAVIVALTATLGCAIVKKH